jgi:hypothetical protein
MSRTLTDLDQDLDVLLVLGKGRRERALPYGHKTALALDREQRNARRERSRMSLQPTAAPPTCTRERPSSRSALGTVTVPKRLGNERSTPESCMPKRSGNKPKQDE